MRVIAIRPQPGCTATVAAAAGIGLDVEPWPLFEIVGRAWRPPAPETIDALLLGSANAVRHFGPALAQFAGMPAYAVGEATAAAARAAGLPVAATGTRDLQALVGTLAGPLRLLRPCGADHVALHPPAGVSIDTRVVYASEPRSLSPAQAARLGEGALVLLHSGLAAAHLRAECTRLGVPLSAVALAALAPRIAAAAGSGWRTVRVADAPGDSALLALARDMCHKPDGE